MIRLQSLVNTNDGLQITYIEDADIHQGSGVMMARTVDIPHAVLPQALLDEIIDSALQVIEFARVTIREPVEQFRAAR
jgi:hypothetical protein